MKSKFKIDISTLDLPKQIIKSACFHTNRSYVYCGLSNGTIMCYDFTRPGVAADEAVVAELLHHNGPVRSVQCHPRHCLLASGGDDRTVCVWNTDNHRRLFTLRGHEDYVRCLVWHSQYPWLVSGSDDCTVRIWNWQSRTEVATVTGSQHWLVSIALHPSRDLMVTASWDMAVRVWDFSSLRNRTCNIGKHSEVTSLFGVMDVVCDKIFDNFMEKLVFVTIHPTQEILAVGHGSQVTLYCLESYSEVGRIYGDKFGLVGSAWQGAGGTGTFDTLVTIARDKIKMWNFKIGVCRESTDTEGVYHGLVSHHKHNYLCSWSNNQLVVFKLVSERPVYVSHLHHLYYIKHGTIRHYNADKEKETVLFQLEPPEKGSRYSSLEYNPTEHSLIINSTSKRMFRDLYQLLVIMDGVVNGKRKTSLSQGKFAVWTAHNRFAHLDDLQNIVVKNLENKNVNFGGFTSGFLLPKTEKNSDSFKHPPCEKLFPGDKPGCLLLQDGDNILLYDIVKKRRLSSGKFDKIKRICWSPDRAFVALSSKYILYICDSNLKVITSYKSRKPVKSFIWHQESGCLLLSTDCQVMYLLPSGHQGSVRSTSEPLYLGLVHHDRLVCVNRKQQLRVLDINSSEFRFKSAVLAGNEQLYLRLIVSGQLLGQSQLQFLREVGQPQLALGFIKDPQSRFSLALEANDLSSASEAASQMDCPEAWMKLGEQSLMNGNIELTEKCFHKAKRYDKLLFLYTITGEKEKLMKLGRIFRVRGEWSQACQVALLLGDTNSVSEIFASAGLNSLVDLLDKTSNRDTDTSPLRFATINSCQNWVKVQGNSKNKIETIGQEEKIQEKYRDQLKTALNGCLPSDTNL